MPQEIEYFKYNNEKGITNIRRYKSKPCYHFPRHSCRAGDFEIAPLCPYYHSEEEARCYYCESIGGKVGHPGTEECKEKVQKPYFLNKKKIIGDSSGRK